MSLSSTGKLLINTNEEGAVEAVVYSKPSVVRNLRSYMNARFAHDRFVCGKWSFMETVNLMTGEKRMNHQERDATDVKNLVQQYMLYVESKKKRSFSKVRGTGKTYKAIYGWSFKLMVDHHLDNFGLKKFATAFVKSLSGGEKLGFVLFEHCEGEQGRYIYLWVCDYEFLGEGREIPKRYKNAMYRNKFTNAFCSKHEEGAECVYKPGDYMRDKHGNVLTETVYFSSRKASSLDFTESKMYKIARQCVVDAYASLKAKTKPVWRFNRLSIRYDQDIKLQHCYLELNRFQQKIESVLNEMMLDHIVIYNHDPLVNADLERVKKPSLDDMEYRLTAIGKELKQIYWHYHKGAFDKQTKFHFTDENHNRLPLIDTRLSKATFLDNIQRLWERFKRDIDAFNKKHQLEQKLALE